MCKSARLTILVFTLTSHRQAGMGHILLETLAGTLSITS